MRVEPGKLESAARFGATELETAPSKIHFPINAQPRGCLSSKLLFEASSNCTLCATSRSCPRGHAPHTSMPRNLTSWAAYLQLGDLHSLFPSHLSPFLCSPLSTLFTSPVPSRSPSLSPNMSPAQVPLHLFTSCPLKQATMTRIQERKLCVVVASAKAHP